MLIASDAVKPGLLSKATGLSSVDALSFVSVRLRLFLDSEMAI